MHAGIVFIIFAIITIAPLHSGSGLVNASEIRLSVAASMTDVFKNLIGDFTSTHEDFKILPNFGSSGGLAKQITQGAPADLYVSANTKWMDYLIDNNQIEAETLHTLAHNSLVLVGREAGSIKSLADLNAMKRIGIGSPASVPAGQYAKEALTKLNLYNELLQAGKLVMAKDVRQALIYADRGETNGSFVYKTDAHLARNADILLEVPTQLYSTISYRMALTSAGNEREEVRIFYDYIVENSPTIVNRYGFRSPQ
ncbi:MAG: molybdate ABC transporter substrate-binding protein [Desulfocapsaceae bacterium]|nr:molybdate ABC transporter substrate-binding protein [Desulfocapsaceae bacterium]